MSPRFRTVLPVKGPDGNIFMLTTNAVRAMKDSGQCTRADVDDLRSRVVTAKSYKEACDVIREYFPLEGDEENAQTEE